MFAFSNARRPGEEYMITQDTLSNLLLGCKERKQSMFCLNDQLSKRQYSRVTVDRLYLVSRLLRSLSSSSDEESVCPIRNGLIGGNLAHDSRPHVDRTGVTQSALNDPTRISNVDSRGPIHYIVVGAPVPGSFTNIYTQVQHPHEVRHGKALFAGLPETERRISASNPKHNRVKRLQPVRRCLSRIW